MPAPLLEAAALAASVGPGGGAPPFAPPTHLTAAAPSGAPLTPPFFPLPENLLHYSFPSEADTLAYVDALKHSDLSDWRSLQEVAERAGGGSCSGAVTTSVLTALYLLGLFNLCVASPASCCVPPASGRRRRRRTVDPTLPPLLNNLQYNLSSLSLEQFSHLPHVPTPDGGRIPLHISVVEQVRKLWDSNPRLLSSVSCSTATESVRSSFISLSGVASGIILAYSVAQLSQCYPDHTPDPNIPPKIWFFPIPKTKKHLPPHFSVPIIPKDIPVPGEDEDDDGCERDEVPLGYDRCALLLSSQPCPYRHWVLLNNETRMGECVPQLCADNFVYVESDQMCHDVNEPGFCPGNRRLYLTASGNAVCDCPEGMFPGPHDNCYYLYEPAYCPQGSVLQFDKNTKTLTCKPDPCGYVNRNLWPDDLPYAPRKDGYCYQFNEQGPCKRGQRFGYDTEKLEATCVSLQEAGLMRPRRSFMYQHMSFPATQDRRYHHYRVSYIIMNGTTWDLEVKGIRRTRRDIPSTFRGGPHFLDSGEMVVPFLDTRAIPRDLIPRLRSRLPRWTPLRRTRRGKSRTRHKHASRQRHHGNNSHSANDAQIPRRKGSRKNPRIQIMSRRQGRSRSKKKRQNGAKTRQGAVRDRNGLGLSVNITDENQDDHIVKVNQSALVAPIVVHQGTSVSRDSGASTGARREHRRNSRRSRGSKVRKGKKKGRRRGKKKGRGHGKKKKGRRRGSGRSQGRKRKKKPGASKNSTRLGHKRKNPRLPFRVPTVLPPTDSNITTDSTVSETSENAGGQDGTETTPDHLSEDDLDSDDEQEQSSSSEMSLPKYLRHRGRRQLGEGGGIIQAPLLSACKPGAKRDYNYKCRPKFIPQERDRRRAANVGSLSNRASRPPRISCPEGTRLDPRGKCQQVS
ncbi:uncharacterized protein [Panulirus ornatus]|uniref:uncharacterized protein n=1 Tax=Panulirus ornatus TaxID=150431 RepID=UPI003A8C63DD